MLMESVCNDSPMFDFVEQAAGREVRVPLGLEPASPTLSIGGEKGVRPSDAELLAQFAA